MAMSADAELARPADRYRYGTKMLSERDRRTAQLGWRDESARMPLERT